jgi:hypothetical protein
MALLSKLSPHHGNQPSHGRLSAPNVSGKCRFSQGDGAAISESRTEGKDWAEGENEARSVFGLQLFEAGKRLLQLVAERLKGMGAVVRELGQDADAESRRGGSCS